MKTKKYPVLKDFYIGSCVLNEDVHPDDVRDTKNSIKSIVNGLRDVAFCEIGKENESIIVKHNLGVIPVRMTSQKTMMAIIHRNKDKAIRLYEITRNHDGYLTDKSAVEAREIGRLLGYTEDSIEEYVNKKYGPKIPIRTDTPDDYNDLHENTITEEINGLNKKIVEVVKDEDGKDVKICTVSGAFVKGKNPGLDFIQFVEGGHHYVDSYPGYKKHIPEDEIWVDEVFYKTPENFHGIVGHEFKERNNMKYHKMSYDKAHDLSNAAEKIYRASKDKLKLRENFQFNKMKDLMKRVI